MALPLFRLPHVTLQRKAQAQHAREFQSKSIKEKAVHLSGLFSEESSAVKVTMSSVWPFDPACWPCASLQPHLPPPCLLARRSTCCCRCHEHACSLFCPVCFFPFSWFKYGYSLVVGVVSVQLPRYVLQHFFDCKSWETTSLKSWDSSCIFFCLFINGWKAQLNTFSSTD